MKCNSKTMLSVALALGLAGVIAYIAFPAAQALIVASAPLLLALICPISMLVMMWAMKTPSKEQASERARESTRAASAPQVGRENA